jgi:hypothetical protein
MHIRMNKAMATLLDMHSVDLSQMPGEMSAGLQELIDGGVSEQDGAILLRRLMTEDDRSIYTSTSEREYLVNHVHVEWYTDVDMKSREYLAHAISYSYGLAAMLSGRFPGVSFIIIVSTNPGTSEYAVVRFFKKRQDDERALDMLDTSAYPFLALEV